ncbi:MAG: hypothetical protein KKF50_01485 [Nanoarchaeota archaeon]|nr:hypothetical protein [Nanoarchaeota archaeon]
MKKLFPILVLLLMFSTTLVVAQSYWGGGYYGNNLGDNLGYGMEQLIDTVQEMFYPLFSIILGGYGDYMFERIMFLFILVALLYVIISRMDVFKENKMVIWVITISISLLATRFLTESDLIQTMLLPYSVLGVALTAVLPILIYFFFVESFSDSATVRKMLWIFYIVVFVGLWASRYDELGQMSWIYMMSAIAALIFLLFDGTIRRAIIKQQMKELDVNSREDLIILVRKQLKELNENYRDGYMTEARYKKIQKRLNKQIETIMKN